MCVCGYKWLLVLSSHIDLEHKTTILFDDGMSGSNNLKRLPLSVPADTHTYMNRNLWLISNMLSLKRYFVPSILSIVEECTSICVVMLL